MEFFDKNVKKILEELKTKEPNSRKSNIYKKRLEKRIAQALRYRHSRSRVTSEQVFEMLKHINPERVPLIFKKIFKDKENALRGSINPGFTINTQLL